MICVILLISLCRWKGLDSIFVLVGVLEFGLSVIVVNLVMNMILSVGLIFVVWCVSLMLLMLGMMIFVSSRLNCVGLFLIVFRFFLLFEYIFILCLVCFRVLVRKFCIELLFLVRRILVMVVFYFCKVMVW